MMASNQPPSSGQNLWTRRQMSSLTTMGAAAGPLGVFALGAAFGLAEAGAFGITSFFAVWGAVVYSALAPGALANVLQTRGQSTVPAAEAQLIFATTPVFNAAVAAVALGETASMNTLFGGAVILAASLAPFLASPDEDK